MTKVIISLIELWQKLVSPLYAPSCRYYPSCSEYAKLAIQKHGPLKGSIKALWRVMRCHPLSKGGVDYP
ncbi:MAG: membrane protein insertion efficiency factor YidD [Aquificaceae bacterium]|nr:membrane protein insertion efficiency factor YidD [Aquificaceae bacterium]MDW8237569.1 membrane protein insertion efficiency factor YidD [Aquificaceae bacterium]